MAKRNQRKKIEKQFNIIKNEQLNKVLKLQEKVNQKQLEKQLCNLSVQNECKNRYKVVDDATIDMKKPSKPGINFCRIFHKSQRLRSRDKKIIKRYLKRSRKVNTMSIDEG